MTKNATVVILQPSKHTSNSNIFTRKQRFSLVNA